MIKKLTLIIGFIICLSSCGKDYVYRIEGELSNLEDQTVYAVFEKDNYKVVDLLKKTGRANHNASCFDFDEILSLKESMPYSVEFAEMIKQSQMFLDTAAEI